MKNEELLNVILDTNKKMDGIIEDTILERILSIVIFNPLEEDRGKSQEQISVVISQYVSEKE